MDGKQPNTCVWFSTSNIDGRREARGSFLEEGRLLELKDSARRLQEGITHKKHFRQMDKACVGWWLIIHEIELWILIEAEQEDSQKAIYVTGGKS
jgi:hypothetical protein